MSAPRALTATFAALLALAAFALLNAVLALDVWWPTAWPALTTLVSPEALVLVLVLAALAARRVPVSRRVVGALAGLWTALAIGRYAEVAVEALFGRPLNLYWDGRHLPRVAVMAAGEAGVIGAVLATAGVLIVLGVLVWALRVVFRRAIAAVATALEHGPARRGASGAAAAGLVLYAVSSAVPLETLHAAFSTPVVVGWANQARFVATAVIPALAERALPPGPVFDGDVAALGGADVVVVFIESYGTTTFDSPTLADRLAPRRAALAEAIAASGARAISATVGSPTFGGASWLAHGALLAGQDLKDPGRYELLLTSDRPTLVGHFRRHGYEAVALMPGLRAAWPEGGFWGFDRILDAASIGYDGPEFGFWRIPDQYAFARLVERELAPRERAPRLIVFPTITSHIPFRPVPPYVADWAALLRTPATAFEPDALARALAQQPDWADPTPGYADAIDYVFAWLTGWIAQPRARPMVAILIGDHQPAATVAGRDARWDVPVHVIADRPQVLERLRAGGFVDGLNPPRAPIGPMHALAPMLVQAMAARAPFSAPTTTP